MLALILTACGASSDLTGPNASQGQPQSVPGQINLVPCFPGDTIPPCYNPYGGR